MDIKLVIPKKIHNKYTYLLNRFKSLEWSGPAWYKVKTDNDGFPIEWRIVHFHPLDLGGHASTEWEAKDLAQILKETYASTPSLKKSYMGLIHSHNTMGAFLSGTDTSTIEEMAPDEGFYGSLVVASGGKATHAFGFSYKDQYKYSHCLEIDDDDIVIVSPELNPQDEWVSEADLIEKNKPKVLPGSQVALWKNNTRNNYGRVSTTKGVETLVSSTILAERKTVYDSLDDEQRKRIEKVINDWDSGEMTDIECETRLQTEKGLTFYQIGVLMSMNDSYKYGYGGAGYGYY